MIALTLFEDGAIAAALIVAAVATWRGIKIIILHRNGEDK